MVFDWDEASGEIAEQGIRYMLMRPDVLMGIAHDLPGEGTTAFLAALEQSVFKRAQASFQRYRDTERFADEDFLGGTLRVAGRLGWGRWSVERREAGAHVIQVDNSPFAAGYGPSSRPVCTAISGILRAVALVTSGVDSSVTEISCKAQGAPVCLFRVTAGTPAASQTQTGEKRGKT